MEDDKLIAGRAMSAVPSKAIIMDANFLLPLNRLLSLVCAGYKATAKMAAQIVTKIKGLTMAKHHEMIMAMAASLMAISIIRRPNS